MIYHQAESATGGEIEKRRRAVGKKIFWFAQRRIQQAFIADARRATEFRQQLLMQSQHRNSASI